MTTRTSQNVHNDNENDTDTRHRAAWNTTEMTDARNIVHNELSKKTASAAKQPMNYRFWIMVPSSTASRKYLWAPE